MKCNIDLPGLLFLACFREIVTAIASNTKHGRNPIAQHGARKLILSQIFQTLETDSQATVHGIRFNFGDPTPVLFVPPPPTKRKREGLIEMHY